MKTHLAVLLICISQVSIADQWVQKANFIGQRSQGVAFSIGQKGYVGTGYYSFQGLFKDFWCYDPANNSWTQVADLPGPERKDAFGFAIGGKGYVGAGYVSAGSGKDFYEYDPVVNTWLQKADLPDARVYPIAFSIGTKGYIGTGRNAALVSKDFWEYDPSLDTWTRKADFAGGPRDQALGFSIGGKGYLGTGYDSTGTNRQDFFEYDTTSNTWTSKADFGGGPVAGASSFTIGMKGYAGIGLTQTSFTKELWQYNPVTDTWLQKLDFQGSDLWSAMNFSINNKGYVCGGDTLITFISSVQSSANWEYSPDSLDGIAELSFEEAGLEIFPNPVHDFFNVHSKYPVLLSVYTIEGKEIFNNRRCESVMRVNAQDWAAGVYYIKAELNNNSFVHSLIKE